MNVGADRDNQPAMFADGWLRGLALVVVPACGGGPDPVVLDAAPIDAAAIDARPVDAATDATPIDGAPVQPLPPLVPDPTFFGDGSFRFNPGYPGAITGAGPLLGTCAVMTRWVDEITYWESLSAYRISPTPAEHLFISAPATPTDSRITCTATALRDDDEAVSAYQYTDGNVELRRRDAHGVLRAAVAPPQLGPVREIVPVAGGRVLVVFDANAWLLDAELAPVPTFGVGGQIGFPGAVRRAVRPLTAAPRIDLITGGVVRRIDPSTGALDPDFGVGGVAALPGGLALRGVALLPDGGELLVGVGAGYVVAATGAITPVTLPPIDPRAVIEDRAGGAYLLSYPTTYAVTLTVTRIAPDGPSSWGAAPSQTIAPPDLCPILVSPPCLDWLRDVRWAWTDADRLGVWFELRTGYTSDFFQGHQPQLLVLTRE